MEDLSILHNYDEQFSANGFFFNDQDFNSIKMSPTSDFNSKDDWQLLLNWQNNINAIQDCFGNSFDLKDNNNQNEFGEGADSDCPILTNALTCPASVKQEPDIEVAKTSSNREKIVFPGDVEPLRLSSNIQTDNLVKKITQARSVLINGEREILGKNIIGLHSLNEIKSSPEENCQITSTVINGKRYKIIIRPKSVAPVSQLVEKCDDETACMGSVKMEQADGLISELQNGDYDVLGCEDMINHPWLLPLEMETTVEPEMCSVDNQIIQPPPSSEPLRVPPLRIKIPKKVRKIKERKPSVEGDTLGDLLTNFEKKITSEMMCDSIESKVSDEDISEPVQGIKKTKSASCGRGRGTRMHDAAAAISRNKLLCLVTGGDSVQLDHDYCSMMLRQNSSPLPSPEPKLIEKNPRKDSGLESGGVSDASEESPSPDNQFSAPVLAPQLASKLLEERRRSKNHMKVTKVAAALFRAANAITSGQATKFRSVIKPSTALDSIDNSSSSASPVSEDMRTSSSSDTSIERPKKKLKLEEYRSRRCDKEKDNSFCTTDTCLESAKPIEETPNDNLDGSEIKIERKEPEDESSKIAVVTEEVVQDIQKVVVEPTEKESYSRPRSVKSETSVRRRRSSSSSTSSAERGRNRNSLRGTRRGRSCSRDPRRYSRSSPRRCSSRDSSSSAGGYTGRRHSYSSRRYRRKSRSRSRSFSREAFRVKNRSNSSRRRTLSTYRRQASTIRRSRSPTFSARDKQQQIEERRVVYVGRIAEGTTNSNLRQRFSRFGPILDISVHFREHGDNYGFVTFAYKDDAYEAVEHGNDDAAFSRYDLCFGGRRSFCKQRYSDLDGMPTCFSGFRDSPVTAHSQNDPADFDLLLRQAKAKLRQRKGS